MGNLSNGVRSESANVGARCPVRKSPAETQSLKPSPALSSGSWNFGTANAPSTNTGVSFSNSRRVTRWNLRSSVRELIALYPRNLGLGYDSTSRKKVTGGLMEIEPRWTAQPRKRSGSFSHFFDVQPLTFSISRFDQ